MLTIEVHQIILSEKDINLLNQLGWTGVHPRCISVGDLIKFNGDTHFVASTGFELVASNISELDEFFK